MHDYKDIRPVGATEPWYATLLAAAGFVAICAVLLTAPEWGALIDAWAMCP
jgi:hypothetical protein